MSKLTKKIVSLVFLTGLLSILLGLVGGLSSERAYRRDAVTDEIAQSSARSQTIVGPVLVIDVEQAPAPDGHVPSEVIVAYPKKLDVEATVDVERRYRGIFDVPVFSTTQRMVGAFDGVTLPAGVTVKRARLLVGLGDPRGLVRVPTLTYAGAPIPFEAGTEDAGGEGIHAALPLDTLAGGASFELAIELAGTHDLAWAPIAGEASVHVTSRWPHPSFVGAALPTDRRIDAQGFEATWRTNPFQSGVSVRSTRANATGLLDAGGRAFGVGFPAPGDSYVQVNRAVKYGFLFVLLTFGVFAVYESTRRLPIHPIQYGIVGVALVLFFLLLLSLAEHVPFAAAYAIATLGCVSLLVYYLRHVLGHWKRGAAFGGMFAGLYGTLFVLLSLEEYALVAGSGVLFTLLAAAMVATRRVDWYRLGETSHEPPDHPYREAPRPV